MDPVLALAIVAYTLYSVFQIAWEAMQLLLDREFSRPEREGIEAIAGSTPGVLGLPDLRTRQSGQTKLIRLHLELDDTLLQADAHRISLAAEERLRTRFPRADIIVHQDPASLGEELKA